MTKFRTIGKVPHRVPRTLQERNSSETLDDRYACYVAAATDLGWTVKTYDEWLES
jgi:hypothetical protein